MDFDLIGTRVAAISAALLPAIVLIVYLYWYDRKHPEPLTLVFKGFLCGVLSLGALYLLWDYFPAYFLWANDGASVLDRIKHAFFSAAFAEETVKLIMLWVLVSRNPYFDEKFDGMLYAVCVGMGFAALENIDYVYIKFGSQWNSVAAVRAVLAVPMHYGCAVLMGYRYSMAKFNPQKGWKRVWQLSTIWTIPVLVHGSYDAISMNEQWNNYVYVVCTVALFVFCYVMHKYCNKLLDKYRNS